MLMLVSHTLGPLPFNRFDAPCPGGIGLFGEREKGLRATVVFATIPHFVLSERAIGILSLPRPVHGQDSGHHRSSRAHEPGNKPSAYSFLSRDMSPPVLSPVKANLMKICPSWSAGRPLSELISQNRVFRKAIYR